MNIPPPLLWTTSFTLLFGLGALLPWVSRVLWRGRWREQAVDLSVGLALLGSLVGAVGAGPALFRTEWGETVPIFTLLPSLAGGDYLPRLVLEIRVDSLSAAFALLVAAFAAVVAFYSFGALRAGHFRRQKDWIASAFNVFVWSTLMSVIVNDLFSLLAVLEIMTLSFAWLALYKQDHYQDADLADHSHIPDAGQQKDARLAPQIYLIVSHTSTAFLLLAFLLLAQRAGSISFDDLRAAAGSAAPWTFFETLVFLLALAGLGIRAGLVPAHFWVSLVHPSSPTNTHAFSLGIAIKVAVFLMIRVFFQFLSPQVGWGYLLLGLAVVTAAVNVWYAIASHDLKKALAYHSVENVGIIVAGVGAALLFRAAGLFPAAALALAAGLFHLLNHAVFKGLLYLATGAIERQTDQNVDSERLGGLLRLWPWTAGAFLIGSISIAGLPPFNGFISEWLTVQALLRGLTGGTLPPLSELALVFGLIVLVASFALTAYCFVKIAGLTLLGQPRVEPQISARWAQTPEVPRTMRGAMLVLAALCLVLGVFPARVAALLGRVAGQALDPVYARLEQVPAPDTLFTGPLELPAVLQVVSVAGLVGMVAWAISRLRLGNSPKVVQPSDPWNCGTPYQSAQTQPTGAALSFLLRDLFGAGWESGSANLPVDYLPAALPLSDGAANGDPRSRQVVIEFFRVGYNYLIGWLLRSSARAERFFQNGDIRRYLLYILVANLLVLAIFLAIAR